jgi:hypothetical protein
MLLHMNNCISYFHCYLCFDTFFFNYLSWYSKYNKLFIDRSTRLVNRMRLQAMGLSVMLSYNIHQIIYHTVWIFAIDPCNNSNELDISVVIVGNSKVLENQKRNYNISINSNTQIYNLLFFILHILNNNNLYHYRRRWCKHSGC